MAGLLGLAGQPGGTGHIPGGIAEMAKQVKVFAAKPNDQRLVLGAHIVEGENQLPKVVI